MNNELAQQILEELQKINNRLSGMDSRLNNIENKLNVTAEQTAKLSEYHTDVMDKLNEFVTKEDIDYIDKKLGEHDREIFKLKNAQ